MSGVRDRIENRWDREPDCNVNRMIAVTAFSVNAFVSLVVDHVTSSESDESRGDRQRFADMLLRATDRLQDASSMAAGILYTAVIQPRDNVAAQQWASRQAARTARSEQSVERLVRTMVTDSGSACAEAAAKLVRLIVTAASAHPGMANNHGIHLMEVVNRHASYEAVPDVDIDSLPTRIGQPPSLNDGAG